MVVSAQGAETAPGIRIRSAIEKGLAPIQASQKIWNKQRDCGSCHHQFLPALALRAARDQGIRLDEAGAHTEAIHSFGQFADLDRAVQFTHVIDPALDHAYRLLAADAAGVAPSLVTAVYARHIAVRQNVDGHWDTTDGRPPQAYSVFTATAVAMRAIQLYSHKSRSEDTRNRVGRAAEWLERSTPRNTEDRTFQLVGLWWAGADKSRLRRLGQALLVTQRDDGGWNSRDGLESDVYSTGQALVALADAG